MTVKLWIFPAQDFAAWCELTGNNPATDIASHADYMAMIAATQADLERDGKEVARVGMRVASMRAQLDAWGIDNTPDNRASIIANEEPIKWLREWHFDFGLTCMGGREVSDLECDELLEHIIDWAAERGLHVGGYFGPFTDT